MEDWASFVDAFSVFLLFNLPWKDEDKELRGIFEAQWGLLRQATQTVTRYVVGQHTEERIRELEEQLVAYGKSVAKVWAAYLPVLRRAQT